MNGTNLFSPNNTQKLLGITTDKPNYLQSKKYFTQDTEITTEQAYSSVMAKLQKYFNGKNITRDIDSVYKSILYLRYYIDISIPTIGTKIIALCRSNLEKKDINAYSIIMANILDIMRDNNMHISDTVLQEVENETNQAISYVKLNIQASIKYHKLLNASIILGLAYQDNNLQPFCNEIIKSIPNGLFDEIISIIIAVPKTDKNKFIFMEQAFQCINNKVQDLRVLSKIAECRFDCYIQNIQSFICEIKNLKITPDIQTTNNKQNIIIQFPQETQDKIVALVIKMNEIISSLVLNITNNPIAIRQLKKMHRLLTSKTHLFNIKNIQNNEQINHFIKYVKQLPNVQT